MSRNIGGGRRRPNATDTRGSATLRVTATIYAGACNTKGATIQRNVDFQPQRKEKGTPNMRTAEKTTQLRREDVKTSLKPMAKPILGSQPQHHRSNRRSRGPPQLQFNPAKSSPRWPAARKRKGRPNPARRPAPSTGAYLYQSGA